MNKTKSYAPGRNLYLRISFLTIFFLAINGLMSQPYVGEIRIFAGNFAPAGWMHCSGQLLAISENTALFSLIGTTYGGDGVSTFALPDLRGRVPVHQGTGPGGSTLMMGEKGGTEHETLQVAHLPAHGHPLAFNKAKGDAVDPSRNFPGRNAAGVNQYGEPTGNMNGNSISQTGAGQPHENLQPYLVSNYIIALYGVYPSRSKDEQSIMNTEEDENAPSNILQSAIDFNELNSNNDDEYLYVDLDGSLSKINTKSVEPFLGEIVIFAFNFAPRGWTQCSGQLLPINQNQALFSLIGTMYGGNGQTTFALPDIRGRVPVGVGQGNGLTPWAPGEKRGTESHTLTVDEIPSHTHAIQVVSSTGNEQSPQGNYLAAVASGVPSWSDMSSGYNPVGVAQTGNSQSHNNRQPFTTLNYAIALQGIYPSRDKNDEDVATKGIDPFLGEIAIFPYNFTPRAYAACNGQIISISQNSALFSLLGTMYGGNGTTQFALPDLQGRAVINWGQGPGLSNYNIGQKGGAETVTLTSGQIPAHTHPLRAASEGVSDDFDNKTFGPIWGGCSTATPDALLYDSILQGTGGGNPHNNLMPSIGLQFSIAMQGIYPPRSKQEETVSP
jgi:microcystin-dependent protein